jgi:hypothetical protein
LKLGFGRFDEKQKLLGVFDLSLPVVDGGDWAEDVDAGRESSGDEFGGDGVGFLSPRSHG